MCGQNEDFRSLKLWKLVNIRVLKSSEVESSWAIKFLMTYDSQKRRDLWPENSQNLRLLGWCHFWVESSSCSDVSCNNVNISCTNTFYSNIDVYNKGQIHIKYKFVPDDRPWHADIQAYFQYQIPVLWLSNLFASYYQIRIADEEKWQIGVINDLF